MIVGIVAFISVNSCSRVRVLSLFFLTLFVSCSTSLYFGCATLTFALFSVSVILTCDLYAFEVVDMNFYLK